MRKNLIDSLLYMFGFNTNIDLGLDSDNHRVYKTSIRSDCVSRNTCCKLASTVEDVYNLDAKGWDSRGVIRSRMEEVKDLVALNKYVLSSIIYYVVNNDYPKWTNPVFHVEHYEFVTLLRAENRLGHSHLIENSESKTLLVSKAGSPSDLLVYMALAARLLTLIGCPLNVRTLEDLETDHYKKIDNMDHICRIYKIDLAISKVEKTKVLNTLINTIGLTTIEKRLISSFVNLPIRHTFNQNDELYFKHMPVIGELTQVLFHIFLIYEFDAKFRKLYPRIPFSRLGTEVIIPIPDEDRYDLSIEPSKLLDEFNLIGSISDLESDNKPYYIPCSPHERKVLTLLEGKTIVWRAEDF